MIHHITNIELRAEYRYKNIILVSCQEPGPSRRTVVPQWARSAATRGDSRGLGWGRRFPVKSGSMDPGGQLQERVHVLASCCQPFSWFGIGSRSFFCVYSSVSV